MDDSNGRAELTRTLRPAGYFGLGVVWLVLTLVSLALWAALPAILSASVGTLGAAPGVVGLAGDPSNLTAFVLSMIIAPPFFIYALLAVTTACVSLMLLCFIYVGRARDPEHAGRRLSRTDYAVDAIGSPLAAFWPKALSLMPTWRSRGTDVLAGLVTLAFRPGFRLVMAAYLLGLCYFFSVAWALWPVTGAALVLCAGVSVVLDAAGVWLVVRSGIARYRALSAQVEHATDAAAAARP